MPKRLRGMGHLAGRHAEQSSLGYTARSDEITLIDYWYCHRQAACGSLVKPRRALATRSDTPLHAARQSLRHVDCGPLFPSWLAQCASSFGTHVPALAAAMERCRRGSNLQQLAPESGRGSWLQLLTVPCRVPPLPPCGKYYLHPKIACRDLQSLPCVCGSHRHGCQQPLQSCR